MLDLQHRAARLLALCSLFAVASAYPELYLDGFANVAKGCLDPPSRGYGAHGAPQPDKTTTFTLTPAGGAAAATSACPGVPYTVSVDYGSSSRRTFLTASAGSFEGAPQKDCPGATVSSGKAANIFTDTLTLPCTATGSLKLSATSAARSTDYFHEASATLPIAAAAKCPGSTCPGAPPASATAAAAPAAPPAATNKTAAAAANGSTPAAAATSKLGDTAAAGGTTSGTVTTTGGCPKSVYGYSCAVPAGDGASLHMSTGGADPPPNPCTATISAANKLAPSDAAAAGALPIHFLLEAPVTGYTGLSFPRKKGVMVPADAVIGTVDPVTGKPSVSAYALADYQPFPSPNNFDGRGWATNMGAAKTAAGDAMLLCFTRLSDSPQAQYVKQLNRQAVELNWAGHSVNAFTVHDLAGSLTVNVADGQAVGNALVVNTSNSYTVPAAHGALMLLAFIVFMPLGGLTARHKWVFADKQKGGLKAAWFQLHRGCQVLAVLLAVAGFILACVCFDVSWSLSDPIPHRLYDVHRFLGVVVIALMLLQAGSGFARPGLSARTRPPWRFGHLALGWTTMALGIVVVFVGVVLMHDLIGRPWLDWLLPVVLLLGLILAAALVGELVKAKLERQGRYRPKTHQYGDSLDAAPSGASKPHIAAGQAGAASGAVASGASSGTVTPSNGGSAGQSAHLLAPGHGHQHEV